LIFKFTKKSFWLFLAICLFSIILAGCCKTCLLSRSELSSIKEVSSYGYQNSTQLTAGNKSAVIIPYKSGEIVDYSINDENIFNSKEPTCLLLTLDDTKAKSFPFISSTNKNGLSYKRSVDDVSVIHSFDMNFNNGDLFETYEVNNKSEKTFSSSAKLNINLTGHGFILLPNDISIMSHNSFISSDYDEIEKCISEHEDNFIINSSKLVGHSFNVKPNSGWFAYVNKHSILLVNYSTFTRSKIPLESKLTISADKNGVHVTVTSNTFQIMPESLHSKKIKYVIVELKSDVETETEMIVALKKIGIPPLLSR